MACLQMLTDAAAIELDCARQNIDWNGRRSIHWRDQSVRLRQRDTGLTDRFRHERDDLCEGLTTMKANEGLRHRTDVRISDRDRHVERQPRAQALRVPDLSIRGDGAQSDFDARWARQETSGNPVGPVDKSARIDHRHLSSNRIAALGSNLNRRTAFRDPLDVEAS